jgi:hypothetical protein
MEDRKRMPPPPLPASVIRTTPSQEAAAPSHQHGTEEIPDSQETADAASSFASMSHPSPKSSSHIDVKEIADSQDTVMTDALPEEEAKERRPSIEPVRYL